MSSSKSSKSNAGSSTKDKSSSKSKTGTSSAPMSSVSKTSSSSSASKSGSGSSTKRLLQELARQTSGAEAGPTSTSPSPVERLGPVSDEELFHWEAVITGKGLGGGYDGGRWLLDIRVPDGKSAADKKSGSGGSSSSSSAGSYPNAPPVVRFVTRIVAPNVGFETGEICLDLLKDAWTPAYTLKMTVEAIWQMLANPGIDSPLNVDVAALVRQGDRVGSEAVVRWGCGEWRWEGR